MPKLLLLTCALIASSCILALSLSYSAQGADAPAQRTFEYATLSRTGSNASWLSPGDNQASVNAFDLYRNLGGKENKDGFHNAQLLSEIGEEGWELVSVVSDGPSVTFYFKRPS
jgi:hypothetical protein